MIVGQFGGFLPRSNESKSKLGKKRETKELGLGMSLVQLVVFDDPA
jgi:hypothetical protein